MSMNPAGARKPKIAVVTPLFPIREEPYRGSFIYKTVLELQNWADIQVFVPVAVYPKARWLQPVSYQYRPVDLSYAPPGVTTRYFEYPTLPVAGRITNGILSGRRLWPLIRPFAPDLILAYWIYPEGYGAVMAGKRLKTPVVLCSRGSDLRRKKDAITKRMLQRTLSRSAFLITVSEELRRHAIELGMPPEKTRAVLNGCDKSVFAPANRRSSRMALGLAEADEIVLFVGHLIEAKGLRELITAFEALAAVRERLTLVCIGEGRFREQVDEWAARTGLAQRVRCLGPKTPVQIAQWMNSADVLCLPSYSEGCPNVVIEALSCGCPVVGTNVGGIPELLTPESGILTPARDSQGLQTALKEALDRPWDREKIARQSQRGWDDAAHETFVICNRFLPSPNSSAGS